MGPDVLAVGAQNEDTTGNEVSLGSPSNNSSVLNIGGESLDVFGHGLPRRLRPTCFLHKNARDLWGAEVKLSLFVAALESGCC